MCIGSAGVLQYGDGLEAVKLRNLDLRRQFALPDLHRNTSSALSKLVEEPRFATSTGLFNAASVAPAVLRWATVWRRLN